MEGTYAGLHDRSLEAYKQYVLHLVASTGGDPEASKPTDEDWAKWHAEFWKTKDEMQARSEVAAATPTGPSQAHLNERARDLGLLEQ